VSLAHHSTASDPERRALTGALAGVLAVSKIVAASESHTDPARVHDALVTEARRLIDAHWATLLAVSEQGQRARRVAGDVVGDVTVADHSALDTLLAQRARSFPLTMEDAADLGGRLLDRPEARSALLMLIRTAGPPHVLILAAPDPDAFGPEAVAAAEALAAAAAAALARRRDAEQEARRLEGHRALTRAAKTLNESLDLATVLRRISHEANRILDGDYTAVYRGTRDGVVIEAATGMPPEMLGFRLAPDQGLSGKVLTTGRSMLTNDYWSLHGLPSNEFFLDLSSCLAVPMHWDGELRGVLTVGYKRSFEVTEEHLGLLEAFAELAAVACTNASVHAGLALAARTDGLTGCLNHAALHETLRREIERAERGPDPALSLVMIDLDDFKAVNEEHGHLVGDEVLRRAGHALRQATRPYDIAARYGGDEFTLLAVDADEEAAQEIARRAIERITNAIGDLCEGSAGRATAGVAQWQSGQGSVELVADADRALLFGKHEDGRGRTVPLSSVPDWFRPGRFARHPDRDAQAPFAPRPPVSAAPAWPDGPRPAEQRLRDRTRALARTAALVTQLTAFIDDPMRMLETAAAGLSEVLDGTGCIIVRLTGAGAGLEPVAGDLTVVDDKAGLARRCLDEHRSILVADATARARLAVPLRVAGAPWGAIEVAAAAGRPGAFDEDDLHLAEAYAAQVGAAIGAGERHAAAMVAASSRSTA